MRTIETLAELRHQVASARARGERVGFVPTMGALHAGHAALVRVARAQCDLVIVSAYVNPLQFGPGEDFAHYPRTPEKDERIAGDAGADLLWRPTQSELQPSVGGVTMTIEPGPLGRVFEGAERPGHFTGVATIVARLIGAVRPDAMYLGEKDWQQLVIVRRLVGEFFLPVEIRAVATVRDADGLALSCRNAYLSTDEHEAALAIPSALMAAADAVTAGGRSVGRLRGKVEVALAAINDIEVGYVEIVDATTLEPLDMLSDSAARLLVSARVGSTRLIDNIELAAVLAPKHAADKHVTAPAATDRGAGASEAAVDDGGSDDEQDECHDELFDSQPTSNTRGPWR
ncbi:MAG: pantoate--beta-alanine ligase [Thermoleophilia bacterium]|nr:pantoate--beta-alanine ligase [Thermoleophilia bacterium]